MSQNVAETMSESQGIIVTKAPKAVEAGKKPADWSIQLTDPFYSEKESEEALEELVELVGVDRVLDAARAQLRVKFQAAVRSLAEAGKEDSEIAEIMQTWKPGDKLGLGGDPVKGLMKSFGSMTPEQQAELVRKLQEMAQA